MSAPPGARNSPQPMKAVASTNNSRTGTPVSTTQPSTVSQLGLGPKPQLEDAKVNDLLALDLGTCAVLFCLLMVDLTITHRNFTTAATCYT